jgi:GTP diphosphokinase / guanosine-3',5'-bis(diphosphate) 3'-diphosphatase
MIKGTEGLNLSFAKCCHPIPGDPIIGLAKGAAGLVIHSEGCKKAMDKLQNRAKIHLSWVKDITDEFVVELRVELERQRGIIAELASAITRAEANIERIGVEEQNARMSVVNVVIHIQGRRHLARVIKRIRSLKAVIRLNRVVNNHS